MTSGNQCPFERAENDFTIAKLARRRLGNDNIIHRNIYLKRRHFLKKTKKKVEVQLGTTLQTRKNTNYKLLISTNEIKHYEHSQTNNLTNPTSILAHSKKKSVDVFQLWWYDGPLGTTLQTRKNTNSKKHSQTNNLTHPTSILEAGIVEDCKR